MDPLHLILALPFLKLDLPLLRTVCHNLVEVQLGAREEPEVYKKEVMRIDENVRVVLARHQLGFKPGMNGYDENTCVLTSIRLENAIEQFKLLKKRKLAEVDIHSVENYKAMIGRGDRQEMRAAYLSKFGVEPEREFEGSEGFSSRTSTVASYLRSVFHDLRRKPRHQKGREGGQKKQTTPEKIRRRYPGTFPDPKWHTARELVKHAE